MFSCVNSKEVGNFFFLPHKLNFPNFSHGQKLCINKILQEVIWESSTGIYWKTNNHGNLMVMQCKDKHRMTQLHNERYSIWKSKKEKQTHMVKNGYKGMLLTKSIN